MNLDFLLALTWYNAIGFLAALITILKFVLSLFSRQGGQTGSWVSKYIPYELLWLLLYAVVLLNIGSYHLDSTDKDPFLISYLIFVPVGVISFWFTMKMDNARQQLIITSILGSLYVSIAGLAVFWRNFTVKSFVKHPNMPEPPGFLHGPYSYWPYVALFGCSLLILISSFKIYSEKNENRVSLILIFSILIFLLAVCRVAWQYTDNNWLIIYNTNP